MNIKSILTVGAAVACTTTAMAIESSNICGYFTKNMNEGFQAVAPSFVTIGIDGYKLSQLKVTGVPDAQREYYVEIQMLNENGIPDTYYDWWQGGRSPHNKGNGWYAGSTIIDGSSSDAEVEFSKGQGLWITAIEGAKIVSSGEVNQNDVVLDLEEGFTMVANPFPTEIGLSTIKVSGVPDAQREYYVEIQMLNENGIPDTYYDWWQGGRSPHNKGNGWYAGSSIITADEDVTFLPGQALWITAIDGTVLTFESPLKKSAESAE